MVNQLAGGSVNPRTLFRNAGEAEPRLLAPFNANISANIQNGKNALGSPQNSLTFLVNVIIAVGSERLGESLLWLHAVSRFWDAFHATQDPSLSRSLS